MGSDANVESIVGMSAELIQKAGNLFFMKYTGITDPAALGEYYRKLGLLCDVNLTLVAGSGIDWAIKSAPMIMEKHLRGAVIPNEQEIRYLYKTL